MGAFYYAEVDENGVLCVDQVDETSQSEVMVRRLARAYPEVIYFHHGAGASN